MGRGKHQASLDLIEAARGILEEIQPATVRAICYRLFVAGYIPDMSTRSTQRVSRHLTIAREEDTIDWTMIVDDQRETNRVASWADPADYIRAVRRSYRKDLWRDQNELVEVWSEKGTVSGVLAPVLEEYGVGFLVQKGFGSYTAVRRACEESLVRPFTVLYVGDHDPSGMYIVRVALLHDDCDDLPDFDAATKKGDPRHRWYVENHGHRCWELDAMNPVDLRARVEEEICNRIDWRAWELAQKTEEAEIATIGTILGEWVKAISRHDDE